MTFFPSHALSIYFSHSSATPNSKRPLWRRGFRNVFQCGVKQFVGSVNEIHFCAALTGFQNSAVEKDNEKEGQ